MLAVWVLPCLLSVTGWFELKPRARVRAVRVRARTRRRVHNCNLRKEEPDGLHEVKPRHGPPDGPGAMMLVAHT
jgi:hypothetical protein